MRRIPGTAALALAALALTGLALAGCSVPAPEPTQVPTQTPAAADDALSGSITVFAAASLTDSFADVAAEFQQLHPNVEITFNFGGSPGLATQIVEGAPVDVFAAASWATMTTMTDAGFVDGEAAVFVTNSLEIAVPAGNPGAVTGLADFANPELTIALCEPAVPCGAAAVTVLESAGVVASVDTLEQDVRAVLTKIELGEVDAGLVYTTDVIAARALVEGIEFPEAEAATGRYPIAQLTDSANPEAAAAFIAFVLSPEGQRILTDAGFGAP